MTAKKRVGGMLLVCDVCGRREQWCPGAKNATEARRQVGSAASATRYGVDWVPGMWRRGNPTEKYIVTQVDRERGEVYGYWEKGGTGDECPQCAVAEARRHRLRLAELGSRRMGTGEPWPPLHACGLCYPTDAYGLPMLIPRQDRAMIRWFLLRVGLDLTPEHAEP